LSPVMAPPVEAAENEISAAGSKLRVAVETLCGKISGAA
jgi:hypothetical protein